MFINFLFRNEHREKIHSTFSALNLKYELPKKKHEPCETTNKYVCDCKTKEMTKLNNILPKIGEYKYLGSVL